ncbi:MAG: transposase [Chlamydiia bacterium]
MGKPRKRHNPDFKLRAVLAVLKRDKTSNELAGELEVHPTQLSEWKKQFIENGAMIFKKTPKKSKGKVQEEGELYEQIGRLKMELEWLKKK